MSTARKFVLYAAELLRERDFAHAARQISCTGQGEPRMGRTEDQGREDVRERSTEDSETTPIVRGVAEAGSSKKSGASDAIVLVRYRIAYP